MKFFSRDIVLKLLTMLDGEGSTLIWHYNFENYYWNSKVVIFSVLPTKGWCIR